MKICIIGPEGSGKTVLASMLNYYLENNDKSGLAFLAQDFPTKKYFDGVQRKLKNNEWPSSTKQGGQVILKWYWATNNKVAKVTMLDYAGQDLREAICTENDQIGLNENVKESDLIIVVCDLYGHLEKKCEEGFIRAGNAWMIEWILQNVRAEQKLLFVLTKIDFFEGELPYDKWNDRQEIENLIKKYMPEFGLTGHKRLLDKHFICAVSAVKCCVEDKDNELVFVPETPLKPRGFDCLIAELVRFIDSGCQRVQPSDPSENMDTNAPCILTEIEVKAEAIIEKCFNAIKSRLKVFKWSLGRKLK